LARKSKKDRPLFPFVVISYLEGERRVHKVDAHTYREAKSLVARELRESLGLWDTNIIDIKDSSAMIARRH
jgi:hypothetical protein